MRYSLPILLLFISSIASATQIQVGYTGSINRLYYAHCQAYDALGSCTSWETTDLSFSTFYQGQEIAVNDSFTGAFIYDSDAPLTGISDDGSQAIHLDAVSNYTFSTDTISLPSASLPSAGNGSFSIVNDGLFGWDSFYVSNWFSSSSWFSSIDFDLMDHDGTVFNDFSVPTALNFSDFETPYFHMFFLRKQDGDQLQIFGRFSEVSAVAAPVPEPATLLLLGTGLGILFVSRFRGKKRKFASGSSTFFQWM